MWQTRTQRTGTIPVPPLPSHTPASGDVSWPAHSDHHRVEAPFARIARRHRQWALLLPSRFAAIARLPTCGGRLNMEIQQHEVSTLHSSGNNEAACGPNDLSRDPG